VDPSVCIDSTSKYSGLTKEYELVRL
jgi:hypothetical protein